MRTLIKISKWTFLICLAIFILFSFYKPPLPEAATMLEPVLREEPRQTAGQSSPFSKKIKDYDYSLVPRGDYDLYGLVISMYDAQNWLDFAHKADPGNIKDICVVWGENITNGVYKKVSYSSGEFTCFYQWDRAITPPFASDKISNNHLIPASDAVAHTLKDIAIGDQVHLKGQLADYSVGLKGQLVFTRKTSTTREDTGNGACEIIYANDIQILKEGPGHLFRNLRDYALWGALVSFILLVWSFVTGIKSDKTLLLERP